MTLTEHFAIVSGATARNAIASAFLRDGNDSDNRSGEQIGSITLHPHQMEAVHRIRASFDEFGGALLCDPVGAGKTFIGLALASDHLPIIVVAPAVLRRMWAQAAELCTRDIVFYSMEGLSRATPEATSKADLLIVDEAHHVRNPSTARYRSVALLAQSRRTLLLTATPIHNSRRELNTLLSLFLGNRASTLSASRLGRCVIRRESRRSTSHDGRPIVRPLEWIQVPTVSPVPEHLLALPPPLPPSDGGDGGVLVAHSLIRQWMSSNAAVEGGLTRRLHRSIALLAALEDGTYPSKDELRAWIGAGDSVQLAFAPVLSAATTDTAKLITVVNAHRHAVSKLRNLIRADESVDDERANLIREIRATHSGEKIVAFSQYADTIDAMFRRLAKAGHVGALTGRGGQVAGGRISRNDAIERFAPLASRSKPPRENERIDLLLTTDLLSEGVNLQDASVVIHLDLPWTPARMEQRLGRIARLGSMHRVVHAYALRPPMSEFDIVGIERVLRTKMEHAGTIVNEFPALAGLVFPTPTADAEPQIVENIRHTLSSWMGDGRQASTIPLIACVRASESGHLAACQVNGLVILVGSRDCRTTESPTWIASTLRWCEGDDSACSDSEAYRALTDVQSYLAGRQALDNACASATSIDIRRIALRRISRAERECRPHQRALIAALASDARSSLSISMGSAAELELKSSMKTFIDDEKWLNHVKAFDPSPRADTNENTDRVIAVLMFLRE